MTIPELISLFDESAVTSGKVAFTFHTNHSGKWNFWCQNHSSDSRKTLCKAIKDVPELASHEIEGFEEVFLEPWDEDGIRIIMTL